SVPHSSRSHRDEWDRATADLGCQLGADSLQLENLSSSHLAAHSQGCTTPWPLEPRFTPYADRPSTLTSRQGPPAVPVRASRSHPCRRCRRQPLSPAPPSATSAHRSPSAPACPD